MLAVLLSSNLGAMEKKRDWIDYASVVANVASAVHLNQIKHDLAERANREGQTRFLVEREAQFREVVFLIEGTITSLENEAQEHPLGALAVALDIKSRFFGSERITSASFRTYEDKDRLKQVLAKLEQIPEKCTAALPPTQVGDAKTLAKYMKEMPDLRRSLLDFSKVSCSRLNLIPWPRVSKA